MRKPRDETSERDASAANVTDEQAGGGRRSQARYREVTTTLNSLRGLVRPLSGGLDPRPLAFGLISDVADAVALRGGAVLLGTATRHRLIAVHGEQPPGGWSSDAIADVACLAEEKGEPRTTTVDDSRVTAVPLIAQEPVASLLLMSEVDSPVVELDAIRPAVSSWEVQLQAAVLFDEVQDLAVRAERSRIAREMHDGIAQDIASMGYLVDNLIADAAPDDRPGLEALRAQIGRLVLELRLSIHDLRDRGMRTGGLAGAISEIARREAHAAGMALHLRIREADAVLTPQDEHDLLRIAQEAVTNAREHSGGRTLWVSCILGSGHVSISVEDDGSGFTGETTGRVGLAIMAERAARLGATLTIGPRSPHGTSINVEMDTTRYPLP